MQLEVTRIIRYALSIALTAVFLLHIGGKINIPILTKFELIAYDTRLKIALPDKIDKKVVIIDIDEKSLSEIGQWPWNRDVMAKIIDVLFDHYEIKEIGFDIVFAEADTDESSIYLKNMASGPLKDNEAFQIEFNKIAASLQRDEIFAKSLEGRNTIMGFILGTETILGSLSTPVARLDAAMDGKIDFVKKESYTANLKILQDSAYGGGFFDNPALDDDGIFRRVPLLQQVNSQLYESLAMALIRTAIGSPPVELVVETDESSRTSTLFLEWVKIGEMFLPVDKSSGILVPYIGLQKSFDYIPATDVLNKKIKKEDLIDKIALFGSSAAGLKDLRTTPLETGYPGVEIHANIIQGALDNRIMHQPEYTKGYEFILLVILGLLLTFLLPAVHVIWGVVISTALTFLLISTNLLAWNQYQLVLPIASPVLLTVLMFIFQMTYGFFVESRGKRQLANLFGKYVPPELVDEMSQNMNEINLDGEIKDMSVLFSDVRGFTTISESLEPKELTDYINGFLTPITEVIHNQRGTVDKYMGDAVMAFWGAPLDDPQHALHALMAALKMNERMVTLRDEFAAKGWPEIRVGVGVNTGEMNVGNKGSEFRVDYTVLGDAVNLGSRLEGLTKNYGVDIITSEHTKYAVPEFEYRELDRVKVKGKDKPVTIFEPLGLLEDVPKEIRKELKRFHTALKYYRGQHWDDAEREIFSLNRSDPDRKIYQIYLERIMEYRKTPPPSDWDGSFTHTSK